jgi:uncharacterized protein RhaS with RHS repeats
MRFNINPRFGRVRPFISINSTNDGAGGELKAGVVTYSTNDDGVETYQVTDFGGSVRSDHAYDLIQERLGNETTDRLVSDDCSDVNVVGTIKQNEVATAQKDEKPELTVVAPTEEPVTAVATA